MSEKKKLVVAEGKNLLPEIEEWQIREYYDREEVEWIDANTILLHGMNEGRMFRVIRPQDIEDEEGWEDLPPIANWQVREIWDRKDYRYISKHVVQRTDGRKWRVYNGEQIVYIRG